MPKQLNRPCSIFFEVATARRNNNHQFQRPLPAGVVHLADDIGDGVSECLLIFGCKLAEAADDKCLLNGGDDGFDGRWLDEACGLPIGNQHLAKCARMPYWLVTAMMTKSRRALL